MTKLQKHDRYFLFPYFGVMLMDEYPLNQYSNK